MPKDVGVDICHEFCIIRVPMLDDMLIMRNRGLIPIRGKVVLLYYKLAYLVCPSLVTRGSDLGFFFFKEIKRPRRRADLHLVPRLRMSGTIYLFPHISSCCARGNLYLHHIPIYEVIYSGVKRVCIFIKTSVELGHF